MPSHRGLRPEEEWVRKILQAALAVPVEQHDDQSMPGMYDLRILYPDGSAGAVEVTATADGEMIAFSRAIDWEAWDVAELRGVWAVWAAASARVKTRLKNELPLVLGTFEMAGVRRFSPDFTPGVPGAALAADLGVMHAHRGGTRSPGRIHLSVDLPFERASGFVPTTGDPLAEWVTTFLASPRCEDVRRKLRESGTRETHVFVLIPGLVADAPFAVIELVMQDDAPLPLVDPEVPTEISNVWASTPGQTGTVFRWSPAAGWSTFGKPA
jgi:hypothetical protein